LCAKGLPPVKGKRWRERRKCADGVRLGRWLEEFVEMLEGKEMAGREEDRHSSLRMGACKGEKEGVERSSEC